VRELGLIGLVAMSGTFAFHWSFLSAREAFGFRPAMRFALGVFLALAACSAPCTTSTTVDLATSASMSCSPADGGVRVRYRPFNALGESFVDACTGSIDAGALSFAVTLRTCEPMSASSPALTECSLPTLAPGRYAVGDRQLVLPDDGGVASCE
jgi:hypothetical protein